MIATSTDNRRRGNSRFGRFCFRPQTGNGSAPPTFAAVQAEIAAAMAAGELTLAQKFEWFEKKLKAALADSSITASELGKIARETDLAIEAAQQEAVAARERGLDFVPAQTPRPLAKPSRMPSSRSAGLLTQRPRLEALLHSRQQAEQRDAYLARYEELKIEGAALGAELADLYPAPSGRWSRCSVACALFAECRALHISDPGDGRRTCSDPEFKARRLDGFTADVPSLLEFVHLPDWQSGKEIWPPFQPPFAAQFVLPVPQHPGAHGVRPGIWQRNSAERVAEQARMAAHYATQAAEQEIARKQNSSRKLDCLVKGVGRTCSTRPKKWKQRGWPTSPSVPPSPTKSGAAAGLEARIAADRWHHRRRPEEGTTDAVTSSSLPSASAASPARKS